MKFKKDDVLLLNDQRTARVLEAREDVGGPEPRYYVAYVVGGGRGWWPESAIVGIAKDVEEKEAAKAPAPAAQQAPSPANKRSLGE